MTLKQAIKLLMVNDRNGSWDECETLEEVAEALTEALKDYDETEDTFRFYQDVLSKIKSR